MIVWSIFVLAATVAGQSTTSDPYLIGWYIRPDYTQRFKAGTGWTTSGTVAGDCAPSSTCVLHTGCTSGTLFFEDGAAKTCTSNDECASWTIYDTVPFGAPSATNWECRPPSLVTKSIFYKSLPAAPARATTVYQTVTPTAVAISSDTTLPTSPQSPATAPNLTSTPTPTTAVTPSTSPVVAAEGAESMAWIAGAVVGPIAALGLCAAAYCLRMRRRNQQNRHRAPKREEYWHDQIPDAQQFRPQFEVLPEAVPSPIMLHADTARKKTPELPA